MDIQIRKARSSEMTAVSGLIVSAFGESEGPVINTLVDNLLIDPSAHPLLSLVAVSNNKIVGYILFTNTRVEPSDRKRCSAILAPLAVLPEFQSQGIGRQLITRGLNQLCVAGIDLVFVLGYPEYYSKCGFISAAKLGYDAPYPIPIEHTDAWMVKADPPRPNGHTGGRVVCANALSNPKYWRE